jgi:hypothetical protein
MLAENEWNSNASNVETAFNNSILEDGAVE